MVFVVVVMVAAFSRLMCSLHFDFCDNLSLSTSCYILVSSVCCCSCLFCLFVCFVFCLFLFVVVVVCFVCMFVFVCFVVVVVFILVCFTE